LSSRTTAICQRRRPQFSVYLSFLSHCSLNGRISKKQVFQKLLCTHTHFTQKLLGASLFSIKKLGCCVSCQRGQYAVYRYSSLLHGKTVDVLHCKWLV